MLSNNVKFQKIGRLLVTLGILISLSVFSLAIVAKQAYADESAFIQSVLNEVGETCTFGMTNSDVSYGTEVPIGAKLLQLGNSYDAIVQMQSVELTSSGPIIQAEYQGSVGGETPDWTRDQLLFLAAFSPFLVANQTGYTKNGQVFRASLDNWWALVPRVYIEIKTADESALTETVEFEFASLIVGESVYNNSVPANASGVILKCVNVPSVYVEASSGSYQFAGSVDLTNKPVITLSNTATEMDLQDLHEDDRT